MGKGKGGRMTYRRYAIYYTPSEARLAGFGAKWLGWDIAAGRAALQDEPDGLPAPLQQITAPPRRYGFHATIKPPFRLAPGQTAAALEAALARLAGQMPPIPLDGLRLAALGGFIALVPQGETAPLDGLAALVVETLDGFRAAPDAVELARRRTAGLSPAQEVLLMRWGYPWVMGEFRFHMTLTGKLSAARRAPVAAVLNARLAGLLPRPFAIDGLSLVGEDAEGRFHLIHRHALSL